MKHHLTASSFETLARERVAEFAPETDLDVLGATFDLVRVSNQLINDLETLVHRPLGWSWAGFRIMFTVLVAGPREPGQIARLAGVTRASISAVLNTLERDGFVTRLRESRDRRVVTIVLTDAGRAAVIEGYRRQHEVERAWLGSLSDTKRSQLIAALRTLLEHRPDFVDDDQAEQDLPG
ncbi:MAG: MarR family transcriptional regulator [Actinobacteria bacterium]|nr:MarR family transcriptional regulator [Actinomycetota bacterium]